jgi:hypothetical protein
VRLRAAISKGRVRNVIKANLNLKDMETSDNEQPTQEELEEVFKYAANLLFNEKRSPEETKAILIRRGLDEEGADFVLETLGKAKLEKAKKEMLYGALWCIGGTLATAAQIGFIFWGAILFGTIQFLRGLVHTGWLKGTIFQSDNSIED